MEHNSVSLKDIKSAKLYKEISRLLDLIKNPDLTTDVRLRRIHDLFWIHSDILYKEEKIYYKIIKISNKKDIEKNVLDIIFSYSHMRQYL